MDVLPGWHWAYAQMEKEGYHSAAALEFCNSAEEVWESGTSWHAIATRAGRESHGGDDDSWPPSDESEVINSGASFGARRRFGGAIDEGLKIESRELALEGAVAPLGSAGADSAMLSPATPGSAQGTGMGRLLELLPGGFVSPNLFSALQGALPWMRGPGSARQQGAPMPSTPLRTMVTC